MANIPPTRRGRLGFYEAHLAPWAEHAAAIGVLPEMVEELGQLAQEARAALEAHEAAILAAKAATLGFHESIAALSARGSAMLKLIQARAQTAGAAVYGLAQIDPPAAASPLGPPGRPTKLDGAMLPSGEIILTWKCRNPRGATGTVYEIRRSLDGGPMEHLALSGGKRFRDAEIPAGTRRIDYQVRGVRGGLSGPASELVVRIGTDASSAIPRALAA